MKSILLVDDEMEVAAGLQSTLGHFGFHVELADNFESAHRWVERTRFDLILIDFNVKSEKSPHPCGGNGAGLVRELRDSNVIIPILIYTVLEGELYETASLDAGADDFILKTAPIASLVSRLRAHIRRHERDWGH